MSDFQDAIAPEPVEYLGYYEDGVIRLPVRTGWPDGTPVTVRVADLASENLARNMGRVIIAGFGLAGRWVADILERHEIEYVIVEENRETVETQRGLGRRIIEGSIADEHALLIAGIASASMLVLTVPEEDTVLRATSLARQLQPDIYIVARTTHVSTGMEASQCGANEVIKAEQAVARFFYEAVLRKVSAVSGAESLAVRA
jgi:voltage-gated potassium channel Kch